MAKTKSQLLNQLSKFTRAYLIAAYWTNDDSEGLGGQDYRFTSGPKRMDEKLTKDGLLIAIKTCKEFQAQNAELLAQAGDDEQNGIDFWLTRNGHGSGFLDRDYDESVKESLANAARKMGGSDLYKGDNGKLYFI